MTRVELFAALSAAQLVLGELLLRGGSAGMVPEIIDKFDLAIVPKDNLLTLLDYVDVAGVLSEVTD